MGGGGHRGRRWPENCGGLFGQFVLEDLCMADGVSLLLNDDKRILRHFMQEALVFCISPVPWPHAIMQNFHNTHMNKS